MVNLESVKWGLEELSSELEQKRLWLGGSEEMSSFEEAVCVTFDDSGLDRAIEKNRCEIFDTEMVEEIKTLQKLIQKIPANLPPEEVIKHPIMDQIRQISTQLLSAVKSVTKQ